MAHGGVLGKGVYLDGMNDLIDMGYPIPYDKNDWYLEFGSTSRETDSAKSRTIFTFPEGSKISFSLNELKFYNPKITNTAARTQTMPITGLIQANKYFHFGVKILNQAGQRVLTPYINGTAIIRNGSPNITYEIENPNNPYTLDFSLTTIISSTDGRGSLSATQVSTARTCHSKAGSMSSECTIYLTTKKKPGSMNSYAIKRLEHSSMCQPFQRNQHCKANVFVGLPPVMGSTTYIRLSRLPIQLVYLISFQGPRD